MVITYLFFSLLFLTNTKSLVSLSSLRLPTSFSLYRNSLIIVLLALAGTPPFIVFTGKFYILSLAFQLAENWIAFFLVFLNLIVMYFYIQNLRLLTSKKSKQVFYIKGFYVFVPKILVVVIYNLLFITWFSTFIVQDIYIILESLVQQLI